MIDKRILRLAVLGGLAFSLPVHAQYSSPIRDVDNGARQPVNFTATIVVPNGNQTGSNSSAVTISAGKRLVIETVSFLGIVTTGEFGFITIQVTAGAGTAAGATGASHVIPMVKLTNTSFGSDFIGGNGALRMYADAGSTVTVTYERGGTTGAESIGMNITGHYVNLP
jgi:hypothetical protein